MLIVTAWSGSNFAFAQTWKPVSTEFLSKEVDHITSSADGNLLAAEISGGIYTSTNSGKTWVANNVQNLWTGIASSADGSKLAVAVYGGGIYVTTNAGASWTQTSAPTNYWSCTASSANGSLLVAAIGTNGSIYISPDSGASWTQTSAPTNTFWKSVAASADGSKLVAAIGYLGIKGAIYTSTNSGTTWTQTSAPTNTWSSVASSADGSKLIAAVGFPAKGVIYTSTDSGATWVSNSAPSAPEGWQQVASSADGIKLVAVECDASLVSISTNSGTTWNSNNLSGVVNLLSVASSADGGKLFAGSYGSPQDPGGLIFILQTSLPPQLNVLPANTNLTLSWIIPSTNFVLQQSFDLTSWTDMTNAPVLNLTNLQSEVFLSPTGSSGFYRLKTP